MCAGPPVPGAPRALDEDPLGDYHGLVKEIYCPRCLEQRLLGGPNLLGGACLLGKTNLGDLASLALQTVWNKGSRADGKLGGGGGRAAQEDPDPALEVGLCWRPPPTPHPQMYCMVEHIVWHRLRGERSWPRRDTLQVRPFVDYKT